MNFAKFLRTSFLHNTSRRLLLKKNHNKGLAGDTRLKNCSEKSNKILEANRPKVVNLKPGTTLIKDFVAGDFSEFN